MDFKNFFKTDHFNKILIGLAALVIILFFFTAGIFVGYEKARFSFRWGENYYNNIIGQRGELNLDRQFFNARNGVGKIININGNNIIIKDQNNTEKTIVVDDKTVIRVQNQTIKISDLKIDDNIVVIGSPNDSGQVAAKLIRVLPPDNDMFPPPLNNTMTNPPLNN